MDKLRIGTRGSQLALWQAHWVKSELEREHKGLTVELEIIKTTGDKITDVPLAQVGGKGLFVKEIEEALIEDRVHLAVHSMKDVPTEFPEGLSLRCITEREDPRDALLTTDGSKIADLKEGARIGTSSLRRSSQLFKKRPDFKICELRGNLDTRIRKLEEGQFDAIILASAGLRRLGWEDKISEYIDPKFMIPAIGQGALGIESKTDNDEVNAMIDFFNHDNTSNAVKAERACLKRLEGGCQVPIAAFGTIEGDTLSMDGLVASVDGTNIITAQISGSVKECEALGIKLAEDLLSQGGDKILREVYDNPDAFK